MIIIAVPIRLARSSVLIFINLCISLITLWAANGLRFTVGNRPYECFTSMGTYEDHTSGLEEFSLWLGAVCFFPYVFLLIDLAIWWIGKKVAEESQAASPSK